MCPTTTQEQNQNQSLEILAEELRKKLQSTTDPILVFDIGDKDRFKREHLSLYLKGGLAAWKWNTKEEEEEEPRISSYNLKRQGLDNDSIKQERIFLLDVRTPDEFKGWNIEGSHNIPMAKVPQSLGQIPKKKK